MKGIHIIASFYECENTKALLNKSLLKEELIRHIKNSGLNVVGNCFYKFGNGCGITGIVLISESHVSIHTWPEKNNSLTLDIYTCNVSRNNENKAKALFESLKEFFKPKKIKKKVLRR